MARIPDSRDLLYPCCSATSGENASTQSCQIVHYGAIALLDVPVPRCTHQVALMQYFTDASNSGRVRHCMLPSRICVFGSPECLIMLGTALKVGRTEEDLAVWSLRVSRADVRGRWIIVDGSFQPMEEFPAAGCASGKPHLYQNSWA